MIKRIKNYIADRKIKRSMRNAFNPSQDSIKQARVAFMQEAFPSYSNSRSIFSKYGAFKYAVLAIVAVLILNSAAAAYADVADVPASNILYGYKRLAENVQLQVATPDIKPALEVKFAARRVKELDDLDQTTNDSNNDKKDIRNSNQKAIKIKLENDLKDQIESVQNTIKEHPVLEKKINTSSFCTQFNTSRVRNDMVNENSSSSEEFIGKISGLCATSSNSASQDLNIKHEDIQTQSINKDSGNNEGKKNNDDSNSNKKRSFFFNINKDISTTTIHSSVKANVELE